MPVSGAMAMAFVRCPTMPVRYGIVSSLSSSFQGLFLQHHQQQLKPSNVSLASSSCGPSTPLLVVAHQGYKMKTHKASAKRFRVTGSGKIICRRAGKQHLLWKKNTKRKNRLSKMALVEKADYENITHALPYMKVSKK